MFKSSKDVDEERQKYLKSTNNFVNFGQNDGLKFFMIHKNYQENMIEKMKGSDFLFDYIGREYYSSHKVILSWRSYVRCSDWLRNKTATINSKNKNN